MYNNRNKRYESYWVMDEFVRNSKAVTDAVDDFENTAESACDAMDELEDANTELVDERDDLQEANDAMEERLKAIDPEAILKVLKALEETAIHIANKVRAAYKIEIPEKMNEVESENSDDGPGIVSNGPGKSVGNEASPEIPANGITRPQIP